jgi:hypothetical protein
MVESYLRYHYLPVLWIMAQSAIQAELITMRIILIQISHKHENRSKKEAVGRMRHDNFPQIKIKIL